ncbi:MAG: hypothetical protein NTZ33_12055 [Bacteroidetes bacterium]|nr:hypothetical protein [Bacteroidota bacterium]
MIREDKEHFNKSLIIIALFWLSITSCKYIHKSQHWVFIPTDTINFAYKNISKMNSVYVDSSIYNWISFSDKELSEIVLMKKGFYNSTFVFHINNTIKESKQYIINNYQYFVKDTNKIFLLVSEKTKIIPENLNKIEQHNYKYSLLSINNKGEVVDTIKIINNLDKNLILGHIYPYAIQNNEDSTIYITDVTVSSKFGSKPNNDYCINVKSRLDMFSQENFVYIIVKKNNTAYIKSCNNHFPSILLDTNLIFYDYFPHFSISKSKSILHIYFDLDTIYEAKFLDNKTIKHPIQSKYKTKFVNFDMNEYFNYEYIFKSSSEKSAFVYIKSNFKNGQIYVIVKKPIKYENSDGTVNNARDNPFSVIVIDSNYKQLGEFDIPPEYSKHNSFIVNNGIAFLNEKLTETDPNKYLHYVVFELKNTKK